jgi:hypothetical protein
MQALAVSLVNKQALVEAINDAWALVAVTTLLALVVVPLARRTPKP